MSLIDENLFPQAAVMIHDGIEISDERKAEIKAIFIEGLVRFLSIYAETEIGEGIQIDITKVALHVNSARFENDDLYCIESIDDVYRLLEQLTITGLPIWRFLRLTDYQKRIFESGYSELLVSAKMKAAAERPCYGCIWFDESETPFGMLRKCRKPETEFEIYRRGGIDPDIITECKWCTTLDKIPDEIKKLLDFYRIRFMNSVESARNNFRRKLNEDPFRIPKELSDDENVDLETYYDPILDLVCAFRSHKTKTGRQTEIRRAMYIEGMIRFFEIYAQCEVGNGYIADIKNIALYVNELESSEIRFIKSYEDVYGDLEEKIINGFNVKKFIKYDDEY